MTKPVDITVDGIRIYSREDGALEFASAEFAPRVGPRDCDRQDSEGRWVLGPHCGLSYYGAAVRVAEVLIADRLKQSQGKTNEQG